MIYYEENIVKYNGKYKAKVYDNGWVYLCHLNPDTHTWEDMIFDDKEDAGNAIAEYYEAKRCREEDTIFYEQNMNY